MRKAIIPWLSDTPPASEPSTEKKIDLIDAPQPLEWDPPLIGDWIKSVTETEQFLLKKLLPRDSNILVSGTPKVSFKSWLVKSMAIAISSGKPIGPFDPVNPEGEHVLYLYAEGARIGTRDRYLMLENGLQAPVVENKKLHFAHREPITLQDKDWIRKICEVIKRYGIKLLIIDTLAMHAGCNENDAKEIADVVRVFNEFRALGASVIFVHHLQKESFSSKMGSKVDKDIDQDVRGSTAIIGFYDQHWAMRKRIAKQDYNDLIVRSKEAGELKYEMYWTFQEKTENEEGSAKFELLPVDSDKTKNEVKGDIMQGLMPGEQYTRKRIKEISELSWDELDDLIEDLLSDGKLTMQGRGFVVNESKDEENV